MGQPDYTASPVDRTMYVRLDIGNEESLDRGCICILVFMAGPLVLKYYLLNFSSTYIFDSYLISYNYV